MWSTCHRIVTVTPLHAISHIFLSIKTTKQYSNELKFPHPTNAENHQYRFKFHSRVKQPGESVAAYMSELRKLAEICNFDDTLADILQDRLVCGIADEKVQRLLLTEKELTLDKAYTLCIAQESASRDTSVLKGEQVNKVCSQRKPRKEKSQSSSSHHKRTPRQKKACYRCGDESHMANVCSHKNT